MTKKPYIIPSKTNNKNMERYLHKKLSEIGEGGGGSGGKYYGHFSTPEELPEGDTPGYAYVGENPSSIYDFVDGEWRDSGQTIDQSPTGNDEDIDQNEDGKLQFANRVYNAQQPNEKGYKILRKDAAFAEQVTDVNTVYEIRYDFDLNAGSVTIPAGCVLKFTGGKLSNGTIVGDGTRIAADLVQIFGTDITFEGDFVIDKSFPEWFGAESLYYNPSGEHYTPAGQSLPEEADTLPDSSFAFNSSFSLASLSSGLVYCQRKVYKVEHTITVPSKCVLQMQEETIFDVRMTGSGLNKVVQDKDTSNFSTAPVGDAVSLLRNELFDTDSMAKAFSIGSVKTKIIGRGTITLVNSRYTIGILVNGRGYHALDMSYESPYIDVRTIGGLGACIAPDVRDLVGEGVPSDEIGNNGEYYWDRTNEKYYKKENDTWAEKWGNKKKGNLFNVSLRIEVGSGWPDSGRIIRPKIRLWDMYGWRGVEIYTHNGGWCNDGFWEGTVSNKHGSFISIFTNYNVGYQDFSEVTEQFDAYCQNDCSPFYAIRCQMCVAPRTWDLSWIKPERLERGMDERAIYLGKFTEDNRIKTDGNLYFTNLGKNNDNEGRYVSISRTPELAQTTGFVNLFQYRTPRNANGVANHFHVFDSPCANVSDAIQVGVTTSANEVVPPRELFDGESTTYRAIDCGNNLFGFITRIGGNNTLFDNTCSWVKLTYITKKIAVGKIFAFIYCTNASNASDFSVQLPMSYGVGYTEDIYLPVHFYSSGVYYFGLFITENVSGFSLDVLSLEHITGLRKVYASGWKYPDKGTRAQLPDAAPNGAKYYDMDNSVQLVNIGTLSEPNWTDIRSVCQTAILYNANPGQQMFWKGLDGNTKSSIEEFVETGDVLPLKNSLFANNSTISKIGKYPISQPTNLSGAFTDMGNLEELPFIDFSQVTNCQATFRRCSKLKSIRAYDMSSVTDVYQMFYRDSALESIPVLNWSAVSRTNDAFRSCPNLINLGGFIGLATSLSLSDSPLLTRDSVLNVFNNLATVETSQTITLHATVYALLSSADIAIAEGKGWTVASS